MIHCTVVTSASNPCSIAGSATDSAVKSLAITSTASAMAPSPRICALLSASAAPPAQPPSNPDPHKRSPHAAHPRTKVAGNLPQSGAAATLKRMSPLRHFARRPRRPSSNSVAKKLQKADNGSNCPEGLREPKVERIGVVATVEQEQMPLPLEERPDDTRAFAHTAINIAGIAAAIVMMWAIDASRRNGWR